MNKLVKKICLLMAGIMCFGLAGCNVIGSGEDPDKDKDEVEKGDYSQYTKLVIDGGGQNAAYNTTPSLIYDKYTLFELKQAKKLLAVGSSSKNTALILERLNLRDRFDAVADGNDIVRSKPDPEVFLLAASRLGLEPRHCLVVEDAQSGIQAGKAGGFYTASVGDAARLGLGDFQLSSLHDLLEIV